METPSPVVGLFDYDLLNSKQFLVIESAGDDSAPVGVTVVVNWLDELA